MYSFETIDLERYRGDDYFLTGFVVPKPEPSESYNPETDAEGYGVNIARTAASPVEENIEVVRLDTCHGQPHLDKLYLPDDSEVDAKVFLNDGYGYNRMKRYLLANWKYFADQYYEYHEAD